MSLSRRISRPSFAKSPPSEQRGRRECRALASPMARPQQKKRAAVTTGLAEHPAFPARWAYDLYVISPGTGLFAPVCDNARTRCAGISTGMPGPHDFTVRSSSVVAQKRLISRGHRIPASRIVTIARTPLLPRRDGRITPLIWGRSQAIFR